MFRELFIKRPVGTRRGRRNRLGTAVLQSEVLEQRLPLASTMSIFNSSVAIGITLSGTRVDTIDNLAVTGTITSDIQLDGAGNGTVAFVGADATLASGTFSVAFDVLGTADVTLQGVTFDLASSAIATANNTFSFDGTDALLTFDGGQVTIVGTSGLLLQLLPPPGETIDFATSPTSVGLNGFGITSTATENPPGVSIPLQSVAIPLDSIVQGLAIEVDGTIQAQGSAIAGDTIGQYDPGTATFFLRNANSSGVPDVPPFNYGLSNWTPLSGDWNGDGTDTIGAYNADTATFFLRNANNSGVADAAFNYGIPGWVPLAGDWNGDGTDTIAVYNPATATFFLRNTNDSGVADATFNYGLPNWTPLAGDWNADQADTVGVFNADTATFFLRNFNSSGPADIAAFNFGGSAWLPVTGDWNSDGIDTIGVVDPATSTFYLRDVNLSGVPDIPPFQYGVPGWVPLAGDWNNSAPGVAFQEAAVDTIAFGVPVDYQPRSQREGTAVFTSPLNRPPVSFEIANASHVSVPDRSGESNAAYEEVFRSLGSDDDTAHVVESLTIERSTDTAVELNEHAHDGLL